MSIDAMKQALEALEECIGYKTSPFMERECEAAITALRAAIEQEPWVKTYTGGQPNYTTPEEKQEPVAWMYTCEGDTGLPVLVHTQKDWAKASWWKEIPLYTAPRQWQGLTDEEVKNCYFVSRADFVDYARAIEAKLKEKNT